MSVWKQGDQGRGGPSKEEKKKDFFDEVGDEFDKIGNKLSKMRTSTSKALGAPQLPPPGAWHRLLGVAASGKVAMPL